MVMVMVEVTEALLIDGETAVVDVDVGTLIVGNVVHLMSRNKHHMLSKNTIIAKASIF